MFQREAIPVQDVLFEIGACVARKSTNTHTRRRLTAQPPLLAVLPPPETEQVGKKNL